MSADTNATLTRLTWVDADQQARIERLYRYAQVGCCVSGVTHDINNYLGAALAYGELVQMDSQLPTEHAQMLGKLIDAVERCSKLVGTLTGVARPEASHHSMVDINALLSDVVLLREYALNVEKIETRLELAADLPSIIADSPKLQLAFLYLLLNCEDLLLKQPGERIVVLRTARDEGGLVVSVWNNGPVIPEDMVSNVFDAGTTTRGEHHVGLGLKLARDNVALHKGEISYSPDQGFIVRLPFDTN